MATARYWRLYVTANDGDGSYVSFSEIELLDGAINRAAGLGGSCAQSGDGAVGGASAAVDGNTSTECGSSLPLPYWWSIDLGAAYTIDTFKLSSQRVVTGRTPTTFKIQYSDNNTDWSDALSVTGSTGWGIQETRTYELPIPWVAGIGTLAITGLTPSLSAGFAATPTQGSLTVSGLTPKHSSTTFMGAAAQGSLAVTGLQPSLATGFSAAPGQGTLSIAGQQPALAVGFAAAPTQCTLTITGLIPKHSSTTFLGTPGQGALAVTGLQPAAAFGFAAAPTIRQLTITGQTPGFANRLLHPIANHWISTHYLCVLTGTADSLPDLTLPISSFQTRMGADPFRVYLSVILPNADAYIAAINARPNGRLKVTRVYNYLDGSFQSFTMAEAPLDTLSTNAGGKSGTTGTLTGYETLVAATAQSVTLYDPITRSNSAGGRRYRCRIDPRLRPLDTAVINGESFVVDGIIHIIDTQTAIMEISEKL